MSSTKPSEIYEEMKNESEMSFLRLQNQRVSKSSWV